MIDQPPLDSDAEELVVMPGQADARHAMLIEWALVLGGGVIGTLTRVAVSLIVGARLGHRFPFDIALVNITGALLIGILAGWRDPQSAHHEKVWLGMAVGFLGAYTTFSSFALGIITLDLSGQALLSLIYLSGSVALGLLSVEGGLALGGRLHRTV